MHLCLLAGLLQRQGPHHPRISRHLCGIMPAMLRNGLENGLSPWGGNITLKFSHLLFGSKTTYYLRRRGWVWRIMAGALDWDSDNQPCVSWFPFHSGSHILLQAGLSVFSDEKWLLLALQRTIQFWKGVYYEMQLYFEKRQPEGVSLSSLFCVCLLLEVYVSNFEKRM